MTEPIRIGMIGLDTSHVSAFAAILNDAGHAYHVPGGRITAAYPGVASQDFELSFGRVDKYTSELKDTYGVPILDSEAAVAEATDAILLLSVDGRVHAEQFARIAPYGKPVFIDKPFAVSSKQALEIAELAERHSVPILSSSSLRYAEALTEELTRAGSREITGADCFGPMMIEPALPGFFWYGIHGIEMLYRIMGRGCASVGVETSKGETVITALWEDGRIGTVRGNRKSNFRYGAFIHYADQTRFVDVSAHPKPVYAGLLERIMFLFRTGEADIDLADTLEIMKFIECANESASSGQRVKIKSGGRL